MAPEESSVPIVSTPKSARRDGAAGRGGRGGDAGLVSRRRIPAGRRGLRRHRRWRAPLGGSEGPGRPLRGNAAAAPPAAASRGRSEPRRRAAPRSCPVAYRAAVHRRADDGGVGTGAAAARALDRRDAWPATAVHDAGPCGGEARGPLPAGRGLLSTQARDVAREAE